MKRITTARYFAVMHKSAHTREWRGPLDFPTGQIEVSVEYEAEAGVPVSGYRPNDPGNAPGVSVINIFDEQGNNIADVVREKYPDVLAALEQQILSALGKGEEEAAEAHEIGDY